MINHHSNKRDAPHGQGNLVLRVAVVCGGLVLGGCSGPSVQFDPAPAPPWIQERVSDPSQSTITAVGSASATLNPRRDEDLAARNAKAQVATLFESKVAARSSDWSLSSVGGASTTDRTVASQSVDVRSNVTVEDVRTEARYRDGATRSQYVRIVVDRAAWTARLQRRLASGLAEVGSHLEAARSALTSRRAFAAYDACVKGLTKGREIEPDIVVIDLLARELGIREKLLEHRTGLGEVLSKLRDAHKVAIRVEGQKQAAEQLTRDLQGFLAKHGFAVVGRAQSGVVQVHVKMAKRFVRTEAVAGRKENVFAATGSLRVVDADGSEVTQLTINLDGGRYEERDTDKEEAQKKALTLAADTLAARFRSAFREAFPTEP